VATRTSKKKNDAGSRVSRFGVCRGTEDQLVLDYQKSGNSDTFLKIYEPRLPTIRYLARRFHGAGDDMQSEVLTVFMRAVRGFGRGTGPKKSFNTYFYTSVLNHIKNLNKSKHREKRTTVDGLSPEDVMVCLDAPILPDGLDQCTYHEIIPDRGVRTCNIDLRTAMRKIAESNWVLTDILLEASSGIGRGMKNKIHKRYALAHNVKDPQVVIREDVDMPENSYDILDWFVKEGVIHYQVKVNGKIALKELARVLSKVCRPPAN